MKGFKAVDPKLNGKEIALEWEKTRHHPAQDDMNQPLNFDAAAKFTRVDFAVGYLLAEETTRPTWNQGDFFAELAKKEQQTGKAGALQAGPPER